MFFNLVGGNPPQSYQKCCQFQDGKKKKLKTREPPSPLFPCKHCDFLWVVPKYGPLSAPWGPAQSPGPEVGRSKSSSGCGLCVYENPPSLPRSDNLASPQIRVRASPRTGCSPRPPTFWAKRESDRSNGCGISNVVFQLASVSLALGEMLSTYRKCQKRGAWVAQLVKRPTSARSRSRGPGVRAPCLALC